jgi:acetyl esterase/lipase
MESLWTRRSVLKTATSGVASLALNSERSSIAEEIQAATFTYKTVGKCEIKADVYRKEKDNKQPVAVWIHGGALIMGDRRGIDRALLVDLLAAGYAVVSIDYRLAPETKLPAILDDVRDACTWIRGQGPSILGLRVERLVVLGGSAGGYLTLVCGHLIEPRPAALVSFWGYGDIAGAWYSRPDAFYRRQPIVTEAEARASVGSEPVAEPPAGNSRFRFYLYCRQNGLWPREVVGHDPDTEPRAFDALCPERKVSAQYPPTLLVHGTSDTDVPHEQSVQMERALSRHGVPHELISIPDAGHGLSGASNETRADVRRRVIEFLHGR